MGLEEIAAVINENSQRELSDLSLRQKYVLYMVASCLYYHYDKAFMEDSKYDLICKDLLEDYDPDIVHVDKELLKAGTGYSLVYGTTTHNICNTLIRREII